MNVSREKFINMFFHKSKFSLGRDMRLICIAWEWINLESIWRLCNKQEISRKQMSTLMRNVCYLHMMILLVSFVIISAIIFMLLYDIECQTWLMKNGPLNNIVAWNDRQEKLHQANFLIYSFPSISNVLMLSVPQD